MKFIVIAAFCVVLGCSKDHRISTALDTWNENYVSNLVNKPAPPAVDNEGVIRECKDNSNLSEVWCPHCDEKVGEISKRDPNFWWICPKGEIDHHIPSQTGCEWGTCDQCGEGCCVSEEIH